MLTDGRTDMTKSKIAFRNFAKAPGTVSAAQGNNCCFFSELHMKYINSLYGQNVDIFQCLHFLVPKVSIWLLNVDTKLCPECSPMNVIIKLAIITPSLCSYQNSSVKHYLHDTSSTTSPETAHFPSQTPHSLSNYLSPQQQWALSANFHVHKVLCFPHNKYGVSYCPPFIISVSQSFVFYSGFKEQRSTNSQFVERL